jgi:hypothetical protein
MTYRGPSRANLPGRRIFSSTFLKGLYESCEFENESLLTFVDNPDFSPEDGGYLDGVKLIYKPEAVEQPLLLAQHAERPEQQRSLLRGINIQILRRRIDQRLLVNLIVVFGPLTPTEILVYVVVYDYLEPGLE